MKLSLLVNQERLILKTKHRCIKTYEQRKRNQISVNESLKSSFQSYRKADIEDNFNFTGSDQVN